MKKIMCFDFILPPFTKQCVSFILNMMKQEEFILHVVDKKGENNLQAQLRSHFYFFSCFNAPIDHCPVSKKAQVPVTLLIGYMSCNSESIYLDLKFLNYR